MSEGEENRPEKASAPGPPPPPAQTPEELMASVEKLVVYRVRQMAPHLDAHERDDARQCGREEAWKAAQRYRPSYGAPFASYAMSYITGGIARYLRGEIKQARIIEQARRAGGEYVAEEPGGLDLTFDDDAAIKGRLQTFADRMVAAMYAGIAAGPPDPHTAVGAKTEQALASAALSRVLDRAPPLHRAIKEIRYEKGGMLADVTAATGASERTIRRHHDALLDALRAELEAAEIDAPPEE